MVRLRVSWLLTSRWSIENGVKKGMYLYAYLYII